MAATSPQGDSSALSSCLAGAVSRLCGGEPVRTAPVIEASAMFRGSSLPYPDSMSALSQEDLEVVEQRHLYRKPALPGDSSQSLARQTVGGGRRCRHGWPQAIVYDPLYREKAGRSHRLGDTTRLTCPLLVTAIDKLEKGGAMERYNERLGQGAEWDGQLQKVNEAHRLLRLGLIGDRSAELAEVKALLGDDAFAIAMRSGLASLRPEAKPDVKCLHAQTADELVRDGGNLIGQRVLQDLEELGVPINGSDECCDNCNVQIPLEMARWRLNTCKNNVGKRLSRARKQGAASRATSRATSFAGDACEERDIEDM